MESLCRTTTQLQELEHTFCILRALRAHTYPKEETHLILAKDKVHARKDPAALECSPVL